MVLELFSLAALPTRYAGEKEMRLYLLSRTDTWMLKTVNLLVMLWTCLDYDLLKLKGLCWFGSSEYQCYKHKFVPTWLWGLVLKASRDERQLLLEFQKLQQAEASVGPLRIPRLLVSYTFSISFLCQASQRSSLASRSIRIYFRGSTWPWLKLIEPRKLDGLIPKMAIVPQIEPETYWDILGWKNIHPSTFSMIESCSQLRLYLPDFTARRACQPLPRNLSCAAGIWRFAWESSQGRVVGELLGICDFLGYLRVM